MTKDKITIWIVDPIHGQAGRVGIVPLGIGCLASALDHMFGSKVEVKLFVYPEKVVRELDHAQPDIFAVSNYIWNQNLSLRLLAYAKEKNPSVFTVMGGPHVRFDAESLKVFVQKHNLSAYIPFEAEKPMCSLVERCFEKGSTEANNLGHIPGVYLNVSDYSFEALLIDKKNNYAVNQYGSPYLKGILDEFLKDDHLFPMLETNRGCPYSCTFCAWGVGVGNSILKKEENVIVREAQYIAQNSKKDRWFFADGNFGIFKEDLEFARVLRGLKDKYGYPNRIIYNTAKSNGKRVMEVLDILKDMAPINIAVQSMDKEVLKNIKRKNLKDLEIEDLIKEHQKKGRVVITDLLVPNSGETCESHLNSLRKLLSLGFDFININILRMLPGTEMETDEQRELYGFKTKWRPMDSGWGEYGEKFIFEVDENIISSNAMSEEEMYWLKKIHFMNYLFWSMGFVKPLMKLALQFNVNPVDIMIKLDEDKSSRLSREVLEPLYTDFKNEFFDTREELIAHYSQPEIAKKFASGELRLEKLTLKYLCRLIIQKDIIVELVTTAKEFIRKHCTIDEQLLDLVTQITLDRLRIDFLNAELNKTILYKASLENFNLIKSLRLIPEETAYEQDGFEVTYSFNQDNHNVLLRTLEKYNFDKEPQTALYIALTSGMAPFFIFSTASAAQTAEAAS